MSELDLGSYWALSVVSQEITTAFAGENRRKPPSTLTAVFVRSLGAVQTDSSPLPSIVTHSHILRPH